VGHVVFFWVSTNPLRLRSQVSLLRIYSNRCPGEFKKLMVQEYKHNRRTIQSGSVPFNLKSRLLAPIEREYVPSARIHDWLSTSHIARSYHDSVMLTVFDSPGCRSTSVNPRSTDGGSRACSGKCRYSCAICSCTLYQKQRMCGREAIIDAPRFPQRCLYSAP
jgi:hypothetical protein